MKSNRTVLNQLPALIALLTLAACGTTTDSPPQIVSLGDEFTAKPELERLRYFREVNAIDTLTTRALSGDGVRITVMGDMVDAAHPDLTDAVQKQYNAFSYRGEVRTGDGNQPIGEAALGANDGHGTHIAGTIAAACDGAGIQGLACNSTLDAYNLGAYENIQRFPSEGWEGVDEMEQFITAFTIAMNDINARESSRITTGSFNLESPAIRYEDSGTLAGLSITDIVNTTNGTVGSVEELVTQGMAVMQDQTDAQYLQQMVDKYEDPSIAIMSLMPLSSNWSDLEDAIAEYQQNDGVYLVTESNYQLDDRTSTLNAFPSLSDQVDENLWLSVVMAIPEGMDDLNENSTEADIDALMQTGAYTTPLNSCGALAQAYCVLAPSYTVLSTMTERVAFRGGAGPLFNVEDRLYQSLAGHSMGAPMVAAALALMQENNEKNSLEYSMKDMVKILKQNARRDFPGYDPTKHGQGLLDIGAAVEAM